MSLHLLMRQSAMDCKDLDTLSASILLDRGLTSNTFPMSALALKVLKFWRVLFIHVTLKHLAHSSCKEQEKIMNPTK